MSACDSCLRRTWLVESLAGFIERVATGDGPAPVAELLALPGEELARAVAPLKSERLLAENAEIDPEACRALIDAAGAWAICRCSSSFPEALRQGPDPPAALIGVGDPLLIEGLDHERCVTIVGARRASAYGLSVAENLGRELARAGMHVVSGLALGIDAAAHRGSVTAAGSIAVLGSGPDVPYPPRNRALYREVCRSGVVISERPPGARPYRWSFPARNRIMAGLSAMTVIVEGAERSGSRITVDFAESLGRAVGAVPGPVTASLSSLPNQLLAERGACVVRDAVDVVEEIYGAGARLERGLGPEPDPASAAALEALELGAHTSDEVVSLSGLDAATAAGALTWLELAGYLSVSMSGHLARTALPAPPADPERPDDT